MTRKDYVLIAAALKAARQNSNYRDAQEQMVEQHSADTRAIADALARDNPRFDRNRFLVAAGVQS